MIADDKELLKSAGMATLDTAVAGIDAAMGGAPLATGAWSLSKALLGKGLMLRQKKALEWIEMIQDNPHLFPKEIFETEEFQDTFVTCLEAYIKERDSDKRIILRAIFKDYSSVKNPSIYPIERYYEITKQITLHEAKVFSYLRQLSREIQPGKSFQSTPGQIEATFHLISLGLLIQDDTPRLVGDNPGLRSPFIYILARRELCKIY